MKFLKAFAFFLVAGLALSSCTNEKKLIAETEDALMEGTWYVSYYFDRVNDATSDYDGYTFTFGESDVLTVVNGADVVSGTWMVEFEDGDKENQKLHIELGNVDMWEELSDDWNVESVTSTFVELKSSVFENQELHFTRN